MKWLSKVVPTVVILAFMSACGGGSSSVTPPTGTGEATVESLSSLPSADLSSYDSSATASASLAQRSLAKSLSKALGAGMKAEDTSSRAGCEANMHKQEVFRMSQEVQLDRCYPKAMEKAGFITIPSGSYAYYRIAPPEPTAEEKDQMCDGIPDQMVDEKAKCLEGGESPGGGNMLMRIGAIDGQLRVDMCQGAAGSEKLVSEAGYSAAGTVYTADMMRIGDWGGNEEKSKFHLVVDIGTTGVVEDEIATIGTDGSVSAAGQMSGGFGSGSIAFEKVGSDSSNIVKGAFTGGFIDPFSGLTTSFTGKTYARFNATAGCAKFSFTGSMPGMKASTMIPFNISSDAQASFLSTLGAELGVVLTADTILCPNPSFDPESPGATVKPMVVTTGATCPDVTHTGVECFSITNGSTAGNFGEAVISQTFTKKANSISSYYDGVNAFDLTTLLPSIDTIAFARNWDCVGTFTTIDFQNVSQAQATAMMTAIQSCKALEEKARGNQGMGGYNCGKEEQMNGVNKFAEDGAGGETTFGDFGGKLYLTGNGDCQLQPGQPTVAPPNIFVNVVDAVQKKYCIPSQVEGSGQGSCTEFTLDGSNLATVNMTWLQSTTLSTIQYNMGSPKTADITWVSGNTCTAIYTLEQPNFGKPAGFGGEAPVGGATPGQEGFVPKVCIDAGFTTQQTCGQYCQKPGINCAQ